MIEDKIKRINELYNKAKVEELSEAEKAEQAELRKEYIVNVRRNLRGQLDNIVIQEDDGTTTHLGEKFGERHD